MDEKKRIVDSAEKVLIKNPFNENQEEVNARIDTGAKKCSIDVKLAKKLKLGPIIDVIETRNSHGKSIRPIVETNVTLKGKSKTVKFTVTDRSNLKYSVLIGRNFLKGDYLVDSNEGKL